MDKGTVFLFGAAERGRLCSPLYVASLPELLDHLGQPPEDSEGIWYAIQTLLFQRKLIFFRVSEEGFSVKEYTQGLKLLKQKEIGTILSAICIPGVGDPEIIGALTPLCHLYRSVLILSKRDLYDYLTAK